MSNTTQSPYLRLKRDFALRGWKGLPYALADRRTGAVYLLASLLRRVRTL